ncbi:MAG: hypothetical protein AAB316_22100 [Bacteroidota bacterium]
MVRQMFHTQERRQDMLYAPMKCLREDAWLGEGYYFWYDVQDAEYWGRVSKTTTGYYEVYSSKIDCSKVLDTVFNEEQYLYWLNQIEKVSSMFTERTGQKPTLKEVNEFFKEWGTWKELDGILFQDLPNSETLNLVAPVEVERGGGKKWKRYFAYRKRIQLAVYNLKALQSFELQTISDCFEPVDNQ